MSVMQYRANAPFTQRGFSLFEVLIAALVLGVAVLGFAGLQVRALGSTGEAAFRTQAAVLAADLSERVRMADTGDSASALAQPPAGDPFVQAHLAYLVPTLWTTPALPASWANWVTTNTNSCYFTAITIAPPAAGCTEQQMVNAVAMEARYLAAQLLPQGTVAVRACPSPPGGACVHVGWRGQNATLATAAGCELGVLNNNCFSMRVFF